MGLGQIVFRNKVANRGAEEIANSGKSATRSRHKSTNKIETKEIKIIRQGYAITDFSPP